jgi:hypothetical protein
MGNINNQSFTFKDISDYMKNLANEEVSMLLDTEPFEFMIHVPKEGERLIGDIPPIDLEIASLSAKLHLSEESKPDGVTICLKAYPAGFEFTFTSKESYQEFLDIVNEKMHQVWPE